MLKRITIHAINCFVSLLFLLIMSSSCIDIDQSKNQKKTDPTGPSWEQFDRSCLRFYQKDGQDIYSKAIIFEMLYAKTDIGSERDASLDIKERFICRIPTYNKLLKSVFDLTTKYWQNELGIPTGSENTFRHFFYDVIAGNAVRVSSEDIYYMIRWGGLVTVNYKNYSPCSYSKAFATALLQAYENPQYKKLLDSQWGSWFFRLRAACTLGDVSKTEEILNAYSNRCEQFHYVLLLQDACRCNHLEMVKFLIPCIKDPSAKDLQKLLTTAATLSDSRYLSLLLEKYNITSDILIAAIQNAVKTNSTENVFCLTKKLTEAGMQAQKTYFVDCSTPLIRDNVAMLKELNRAGILISLDSLPAIIADNGPKVLASIEAVMEGKTPFMLASKEMDKAMLAAAAVGNVEVLKKLVKYGGEVNCMGENEESPLAIAKKMNHLECIAYLESLNAVSAKFQLRDIGKRIKEKRENLALQLKNNELKREEVALEQGRNEFMAKIKKYQDDLSRRQAEMLKILSGKNRVLVETLLKAKISYGDPRHCTFNLAFARAQVFKTGDSNRFEILIYTEHSPEIQMIRNEIKQGNIAEVRKFLSLGDSLMLDLLIQTEFKHPEKAHITVLEDGDLIRIVAVSPANVFVKFD